ncbi:uncharacterized protein LAESUDRAFT_813258 [Laetiporus sulphureus 93-53]|uniref:Uncharacterized protein n=1 Tax=Laetiporus sulphureus 93-53 TaxID=1314785 RepID=A0A165DVB4_9APHY|nr:uncharacterized protein LAESUDRAFT_813258 [Laetiporus sulphureus 93-53]KZT05698.1 hypothetical protein LAESUDRAFT_813258 [Laetiporus sulphureus 93-53]
MTRDSVTMLNVQFPGCVYANQGRHLDLYGDNIEVDYKGYEVTAEDFLGVLTECLTVSSPGAVRHYNFKKIESHAGVRLDLFNRLLEEALVTNFFGGLAQAGFLSSAIDEPGLERDAQLTFSVETEHEFDVDMLFLGLPTEAANGSTTRVLPLANYPNPKVNLAVIITHNSHRTRAAEARGLKIRARIAWVVQEHRGSIIVLV